MPFLCVLLLRVLRASVRGPSVLSPNPPPQNRVVRVPYETLPAVCDLYDKGVSATGLSKPFGLGGLRIGWMATRCDELRNAVRNYRFYTAEMTNTPCQFLAVHALGKSDEVVRRNRQLIGENLDRLATFVEQQPSLELQRPKAGTMAMVKQNTGMTSTEFCQQLLEQQRVFLIPSGTMAMPDQSLRFGLGMTGFEDGLERLAAFLK